MPSPERTAAPPHRGLAVAATAMVVAVVLVSSRTPLAQTDLDPFMRQVIERRDLNWKKLQQYVLDEREQVEMRGPSGAPLWGERRDYTWYIRDGFFVRSPLKVNGAPVGEPDRLKYEQEYLERERKRDAGVKAAGGSATDHAPAAPAADEAPRDADGLVRQLRQPQFISSAYFLRFTFDAGRYALVGRERLEGRDVLRIEYYPEKLFSPESRRDRRLASGDARGGRRGKNDEADKSLDAEVIRLMNKSSKVTLWIEPVSHQILKYTFDDLGWNFFPGQWLAQMDAVSASMTMGEPFPEVWLPRGLEINIGLLLAFGNVQMRYTLQYENYRQADVQSKIGVPDRP